MNEKLALEGGSPVRMAPFPSWPIWDEAEERQLLEVLHSGAWGMLDGNKVHSFERAFAEYQQARYGVCMANGSVALEVALRAVGIGRGDEVITTPYTFAATVNSVIAVGAIPILIDIDPRSFLIDAAKIKEAVTARTKAILPVHIAGQPADMDVILDIADRYGMAVVEDACQAWGAEWKGRRVGAMGNAGAFSFQSSKNIAAGEGGIVVTNDERLADLCWSYHNVGRRQDGLWYEHVRLGWNYRMTEWQGALLLAQLARLDDLTQRRQQNAQKLTDALSKIAGIYPATVDARVTRHAWHLYMFRRDPDLSHGGSRDWFLDALRAEGVPCAPGYVSLSQSPALRDGLNWLRGFVPEVAEPRPCPVAERIGASEAVWLTQSLLLGGDQEVSDIATAIEKVQRSAR
jgi:dTDP-4-amino-4,6-dideoxygalactose transaminase